MEFKIKRPWKQSVCVQKSGPGRGQGASGLKLLVLREEAGSVLLGLRRRVGSVLLGLREEAGVCALGLKEEAGV